MPPALSPLPRPSFFPAPRPLPPPEPPPPLPPPPPPPPPLADPSPPLVVVAPERPRARAARFPLAEHEMEDWKAENGKRVRCLMTHCIKLRRSPDFLG
eukprot:2689224-Pyramimonas_sp.AAC.1